MGSPYCPGVDGIILKDAVPGSSPTDQTLYACPSAAVAQHSSRSSRDWHLNYPSFPPLARVPRQVPVLLCSAFTKNACRTRNWDTRVKRKTLKHHLASGHLHPASNSVSYLFGLDLVSGDYQAFFFRSNPSLLTPDHPRDRTTPVPLSSNRHHHKPIGVKSAAVVMKSASVCAAGY